MLPTLNELEPMKVIMPRIRKEWYDELVIIDGGSTDGTIEYCREHGYPVYLQPGKGLPDAETEALKHCTKDIVILFTPDGNSIPELIPVLVEKTMEGYDMVIVSRYLGTAKSYDDDFFTGFGNKFFTGMVNLLFGANYTDTLVGYRSYLRESLIRMKLDRQEEEWWLRKKFFLMNSWELGSSIRAVKLNMKVTEIPGDEPKRIGGVRKLSVFKNGLGVLLHIIFEYVTGLNFTKAA
ncbi:MAG: histidinol phosphate phosphatase [Thermodesulfovibrio sp.]|nr:histidinol phosphate phosphatase [Thermodesulfovibrio sp.]